MQYRVKWWLVGQGHRWWHSEHPDWDSATKKMMALRAFGFHYDRPSGVRVYIPSGQIRRIELSAIKRRKKQ